jgi:hypothetical protein
VRALFADGMHGAVRGHGAHEGEAGGHAAGVRRGEGARRRDGGGAALLPRPRRQHDRDLRLREAPRGTPRRCSISRPPRSGGADAKGRAWLVVRGTSS